MLISFTVSNFRSFKGEATLDLRAPHGAAAGAKPWDGSLQAVAGVYGANASGKTTLFRAIQEMTGQVRSSYRRSAVRGDPFAFDEASQDRATEFSVTFIADDGICYAYGFSVKAGQVVEEWAERYKTARATLLFERKGSAIKFGTALKGPNRAVERTMRDSNLYLSAAAAAGHEGLAPLSGWFSRELRLFGMNGHEAIISDVIDQLADDPDRSDRIVQMLALADLGLHGLEVETRQLTESDKSEFRQFVTIFQSMTSVEVPDDLPDDERVAFGKHLSDGRSYRLPLKEESAGTRAMLCHAFVIDDALRSGATVVFDEIDASLHPLLVRALVRTFQDRRLNPRQAQLVFTTHDVSLMESGYGSGSQLSRDEVWITERDRNGVSTLVALADYSPRERENLARRYLSGRFGGVPESPSLLDPALV
ncbi:MAG: AAA family ATPase [Propionibacteriaceae bacterium]|jgi:energy-coupling factor transporter ATP-binding protein EcfA2|nr:AAA family ATPase [Propionibacteriaceae bacterium]